MDIVSKAITEAPKLTQEEANDLWLENTPQSREKLIYSHLFIVREVCRKIHYTNSKEDIEAEGILGLIKAVEKYDPQIGDSFFSYAYQSIVTHVQKFTGRYSNCLSTPQQFSSDKAKINKLTKELGTTDIEELSKASGINKVRVEKILRLEQSFISLDRTILVYNEPVRLAEAIPGEADTFESVAKMDLVLVRRALDKIENKKHKLILEKAFGFTGETCKTRDIVKHFGDSKSNINNLKRAALASFKRIYLELVNVGEAPPAIKVKPASCKPAIKETTTSTEQPKEVIIKLDKPPKKIREKRRVLKPVNSKYDYSKVDWSMTDKEIAKVTGYPQKAIQAKRLRDNKKLVGGTSRAAAYDYSGIDWSLPIKQIAEETGIPWRALNAKKPKRLKS